MNLNIHKIYIQYFCDTAFDEFIDWPLHYILFCPFQPETLQGCHGQAQSNIWSLGLSLIEMAIGIYPIPVPDAQTVEKLLTDELTPDAIEPKEIGIFQVLEAIVKEPAPKLEHPSFSAEFRDFVDQCLRKDPAERADLKTLLVS